MKKPAVVAGFFLSGFLWMRGYLSAARATVAQGCADVDARIERGEAPGEQEYQRQLGLSVAALEQCREAIDLIKRVLGGNGLREGGSFERRYRDMQALPLHINAHPDRVHERAGRMLLGATQKKF